MNKKNEHNQEYLEWEILESERISNLTFENKLYNLNKDCVIQFYRNSQHDLVAQISGIVDRPDEIEGDFEDGFVPEENIIGYSVNNIFKYKFYGIVIGAYTSSLISLEPKKIQFVADFIFDKVERVPDIYNRELHSLQEWYLSGKGDINFSRSTSRSLHKIYTKERPDIDQNFENAPRESRSHNWDYMLINLKEYSFTIAKVPEEFGPEWATKYSIEYRISLGKIPDREERIANKELISFIFGNPLLKIGSTRYDDKMNIIYQMYCHPWGDNVVSKCQKYGFPPVKVRVAADRSKVERIINDLLPRYIENRETLKLSDVLWKYWIARYSSMGANLPILSSAIETLSEEIIKQLDKKQHYIEPKKFIELISDDLTSIEEKLKDNQYKDKILNKMKGASQRGSNEKFNILFECIDLEIGKVEKEAIKARNKMAHSSQSGMTNNEAKEIIRLTRAYETMFHRIILKVLSYNGEYIDYYHPEHKRRHIDLPIPD